MNQLKKLWRDQKKTVILCGVAVLITIAIIIVVTVLLIHLFKKYDGPEIEELMVKSTEKYLNANASYLPQEGQEIIVEASTLIQGKYMKDFERLTKDTCEGLVKVSKTSSIIRFTPHLKCSNYETQSLYEQILSTEPIVVKDEGLYDINNMYTYRGEFLNNYINFAGFSWRIFKFDAKQIYLILSDTTNTKTLYVYDDRYNETIQSNRGKNNFETSRVFLSLKDIYKNDFVKYHKYMLPIDACVHPRSETDQNKSGAIECTTTVTTNFSMLSVYDYMNASLDPLCIEAASRNCSNYNYLSTSTNKWWLLNGTDENTFDVYGVDTIGRITLDWAAAKKDVRPVIALPSDLLYKSGNGTVNNPYTFYEY